MGSASKGVLADTIKRLEYTLNWRRTVSIDDVEAMAADCGAEVGILSERLRHDSRLTVQADTGKEILLGFTKQAQPIVYFFPARNRTPVERRRAIHAVSPVLATYPPLADITRSS